MKVTVSRGKKSLQIPVPAVAVIQEGQALFVVIGRKGHVNRFFLIIMKVWINYLEYII